MHDMFMKVPRVNGRARTEGRDEWCNILGLNWSASRPQVSQTGTGRGVLSFRNVDVIKRVDAASVSLFRQMCTNALLNEVVFEMVRTGGNDLVEARFTLRNAVIVGIDFAAEGSGPTATNTERVSFQYSEIEYEVETLDHRGESDGVITANYSLRDGAG